MDLGFHLLLSGHNASNPSSGERIVLLHGWLQSSDVWLTTAQHIRDRYHHDVLIIDWHGHGRSKYPAEKLHVDTLEEQLKGILHFYGWDHGRPLIFAGISLGGGMLLRFASGNPDRVGKVMLICSAGLTEKWWSLPSLTYPLRTSILALGSTLSWLGMSKLPGCEALLGHMQLISTTPTYGVSQDVPEQLSLRKVPLSLIWGKFDWVHSLQTDKWCTGRTPRTVHTMIFPFKGHAQLCASIDELQLWGVRHFWSLSDQDLYGIEKSGQKTAQLSYDAHSSSPTSRL